MLCVLGAVCDGVGALAEMVRSAGLGGRSITDRLPGGRAGGPGRAWANYQVPYILLVSKGGEFEKICQFCKTVALSSVGR